MLKLLYAEDEERYRKLVRVFLEPAGFQVVSVSNGQEALEYLADHNDVDLVLLDIMMPLVSGREVCVDIRRTSDIPVIMLTALGEPANEVEGLQMGADDYIAKPFSRDVLLARINTVLRRIRKPDNHRYLEAGFEFAEDRGIIIREDEEVVLTPKESGLLQYLLDNKDMVLSRERILDRVWGADYYGDPRTVDTHIKSLRARLGNYGTLIRTVRGKGYYYQSDAK